MNDREKATLVNIGKGIGGGIVREVGRWILVGFAVVFLLQVVLGWFGYGWDATDNRDTGTRSGVRLRMDHGTGCQYLEARSGGITPRLDRDGKQVCRP